MSTRPGTAEQFVALAGALGGADTEMLRTVAGAAADAVFDHLESLGDPPLGQDDPPPVLALSSVAGVLAAIATTPSPADLQVLLRRASACLAALPEVRAQWAGA